MAVLQWFPMPATLLVCVAIAAILIYIPFLLVGWGRLKVGYNQSAPRTMLDKLPPYAQRANWAHQNAFESFMLFAAAALMAYVTGQDSLVATGAAVLYVLARSLYPLFYILDVPLARSLMFAIGSLCIYTLFFLSCRTALMG